MYSLSLFSAALIAAFDAGLRPSEAGTSESADLQTVAQSAASPSALLIARRQLVVVETAFGTRQAQVHGHLFLSETERGGSSEMDGAILVVSAVDTAGPGPIPPPGEWTSITIHVGDTSLENGDIRFEGVATLYYQIGRRASFAITGSLQPVPGCDGCIVIEINGSEEYARFGGPSKFQLTITSVWD